MHLVLFVCRSVQWESAHQNSELRTQSHGPFSNRLLLFVGWQQHTSVARRARLSLGCERLTLIGRHLPPAITETMKQHRSFLRLALVPLTSRNLLAEYQLPACIFPDEPLCFLRSFSRTSMNRATFTLESLQAAIVRNATKCTLIHSAHCSPLPVVKRQGCGASEPHVVVN